MSPLHGKKLGLLLSTRPDTRNFRHGLNLANAALAAGATVYLYCIDDAVLGLSDPQVQELKRRGLNLYACAYGAQKRSIPTSDLAVFSGLTMVSEMIAAADRFVSFN